MSKKRGVSAEDKRKILLNIYHSKKEPFNLKEMESLGSKAGVVQQTIKDVNQSLVDDNMVYSDKIGSSNFFWSFPSKAYQDRVSTKEICDLKVTQTRVRIEELTTSIREAESIRKDPERHAKIQRFNELNELLKTNESTLSQNKATDPVEFKRIQNQVVLNREGSTRWTENTWTLKKYMTKKRGLSSKEADKYLNIDSKFETDEYVSEKEKQKPRKK